MKKLITYCFLFVSFSVNAQNKAPIYLLPLGKVNTFTLQKVKQSVEQFYKRQCIIKPMVSLSPDILADSKTRYEAGRILRKYRSDQNLLIITEQDIATKKDEVKEWGIFGLGYRPGKTCVISTFRLKRKVSREKFIERLNKVAIHEIGHNCGLNHCSSGDSHCLMNDAKGTIKQVDEEQMKFCANCLRLLK
jgi:archaemetzincin